MIWNITGIFEISFNSSISSLNPWPHLLRALVRIETHFRQPLHLSLSLISQHKLQYLFLGIIQT